MKTKNKHNRNYKNVLFIIARFTLTTIFVLIISGDDFVVNNSGPMRSVNAYSPHITGVSIADAWTRSSSSCRINRRKMPTPTFFSLKEQLLCKNEKALDCGTVTSAVTSSLYHMGHSHSHHDHGHDHPTTILPKNINKKRMIRRLAVILFCWIATCGTKILQIAVNVNGTKRFVGLKQSDWISFVVTSVALTSADKIKKAIHQSVDNFRGFVEGIKKHSKSSETSDVQQQNRNESPWSQQRTSTIHGDRSDADRVTWIGVAVNLLLSVGKLCVGVTSHSSALVADAGHSLSDLVSDFITLWSVNVARIPPDDDHPYGHYKFEAIGSLFLSLTLLATGGSVGLMANKRLMEVLQATPTKSALVDSAVNIPGPLALLMAGLSIVSKEWLFRITKQVGERLRSPVVIANAWHHRSDAYSSVLALMSIAWAMTGFPAADAAAGMLVAGMICMTGSEILVESVKQLSDSADSGLQSEVVEILNELDDDDVIATTSVRARQMGSAASVDVTVEIPSVLSTTATRAVENRVKQRLLNELDKRRGGDLEGNDSTSSSGIIANVYAKPYLHFMEDFEKRSLTLTMAEYDETTFAKLAFEKFDTDFDRRLSLEELKTGLEKTLKIELSTDRVQKLMEEFDVNKNGYLELEEMVTIDKLKKKIELFSKEEKELAIRQEQHLQQQTLLDDMPSTTYIEQQVRNEAKLMYPKIRSVEGVTVHYKSQNSVTVDVNIRITEDEQNGTNENNGLWKIRECAQELKSNLETKLDEIESARIYLDLNSNNYDQKNLAANGTSASSSFLAP